ncbi:MULTISPECIES: hypothetical protein [unclassified Rhodosalinus]|uniref:hypothetical protein n=1 Tax=unclassified Rhodosalinus TaxID=2630183 RepID=UPI00352363A9
MGSLGPVLAYGGWALAPLMAWVALAAGLEGRAGRYLALLALYSGFALVTWAALARSEGPAVAPAAVAIGWAGVAAVSSALFAFGLWAGRRGR